MAREKSEAVEDFGPLFAQPHARARSEDPSTSHAAAAAVEFSGRAGSQRRLCLRCVAEHPGLTAAEIADLARLERHIPSRRLPELREAGMVVNGETRRCRIVGNPSMTWWPS